MKRRKVLFLPTAVGKRGECAGEKTIALILDEITLLGSFYFEFKPGLTTHIGSELEILI